MYVSVEDVYGTAGITSEEVNSTIVKQSILEAESVVDRITNTTYWNIEHKGIVSSSTNNTLTELDVEFSEIEGDFVWIYSGTGSGQKREIDEVDEDTLILTEDWDTNPDTTSRYRIIHTATNAKITELRDGDNNDFFFLKRVPVVSVDNISIDDEDLVSSDFVLYDEIGKIRLTKSRFYSGEPQNIEINYYFGTYPIPYYIKRLTSVYASCFILQTQMGGTHDIPSTYSLPEGSVTIGQAYINIKGTWDTLMKEKERLEKEIGKIPYLA